MISWLQRSLQRHYKWLFSILLVIIIIAFVFTIGAAPGIGRSERASKKELYYGVNLNSREEVQALMDNVNISYLLNSGRTLQNDRFAEQLALARPPMLDLANTLQIPQPDEDDLIEYIKDKPLFKNAQDVFDPSLYQNFYNIVKNNPQLSEDTIRKALAEDYRIDAALKALAGPGNITPFEAQLAVQNKETLWSIDIATLKAKDLSNDIPVNDLALNKFYKRNKQNYTVPAQVKVSSLLFPAQQYLREVQTPSEKELEQFFDSNLPTFFPDFKKGETPRLESVRDKVLVEYRKKRSHRLAAEAANNLTFALYEKNIKAFSSEFNELLKAYKLSLQELSPYSKDNLPQGLSLSPQLLSQAFSLDAEHYYSDIASTKDGYAMLFYRGTIDAVIPPLNEITEQVKADFLKSEKQNLIETKAKILSKNLKKAIKAGQNFTQIAQAETASTQSLDNISLFNTNKDLDPAIQNAILGLRQNEVSEPIQSSTEPSNLYVIYIRKRETPPLSSNDKKVKDFIEQIRSSTANASAQGALNEMIQAGLPNPGKLN